MVEHGLYMVISWSTMFLKHGRPCLKHGQPCFDRVHFTGVARSIFGTMWSKRPEKQLNVNKECDQSVDKSH